MVDKSMIDKPSKEVALEVIERATRGLHEGFLTECLHILQNIPDDHSIVNVGGVIRAALESMASRCCLPDDKTYQTIKAASAKG